MIFFAKLQNIYVHFWKSENMWSTFWLEWCPCTRKLNKFQLFFQTRTVKIRSLKIAKTQIWTKPKSFNMIKSDTLLYEILPKKMNFAEILVKMSSQTRKLKNSTSFEPIFLQPKNSNSKIFGSFIPEKLKPVPKEATKLEPEEIQTRSSFRK